MKALVKKCLPELLQVLSHEYTVYTPRQMNGASRFLPWNREQELELTQNTVLPPKNILFPQTEKMYSFQVRDQALQIAELPPEERPQIIFGIRSCDVASFHCLDQVFLGEGLEDESYRAKRNSTLLIALSCTLPADTCFCQSMGLNPLKAEGADLQMYDLGQEWGLQPLTDGGEKLLLLVESLLHEVSVEPLRSQPQLLQVDMTGVPSQLGQMYEHPLWVEISEKCLSCGVCTYLCPTCHCFDIAGASKGEQGYRFRCWDSCMYVEYSQMAGGDNPRRSIKERVRNRFLHKLHYAQERYGMVLCTGCGRCIAHCPVGVDITTVIDRVKEAEGDE